MRDMEQEAEPEGGPIADKYGRMLTKVDDAIEKLGGNPMEEGKIKENTTKYEPFVEGETFLRKRKFIDKILDYAYYLKNQEEYDYLIKYGPDALESEYAGDFGIEFLQDEYEEVRNEEFSVGNDSNNLDLPKISENKSKNIQKEDLDIGHEDNEPKMLKAELARAGQMIQMLYKAIDKYDGQGEVDFPQWWQKKIIQANTMLDSAFDYIDGKEKVAQIDAVIDMVGEVTTDKEYEASEEEARLEKHPEKDLINKIKAMVAKEKVQEKLTKKNDVGDFVDDFTKSDAKQFKGKSDKKKKEMAVAAYLSKQNK